MPPTAGPRAAPTIPASVQIRAARASVPVTWLRRSSAAHTTAAPATPWTARPATSTPKEGENPHDERGSNEHDDPESEDVHGPAACEESGRQRRESERKVEGGENPGERRDLDVVASENVRQRDRDDRRVGQDDADRDGKQHDWGTP